MIENVLNQTLPGFRGTVGDATMLAHEGNRHAARALKAAGITLVPGGLHMRLDISPYSGTPADVAAIVASLRA